MEHQHQYNPEGVCVICSQTAKVYQKAQAIENHQEVNDHDHDHDHDHSHEGGGSTMKLFGPAIISLMILLSGLALDHLVQVDWFNGPVRLVWYLLAYIPVGFPVLKDALNSIRKGKFFSEFFLMGLATIGAFAIKEYPEGVTVMLFYAVGEAFQTLAVTKAKANIKSLLDQRPDETTVLRNGKPVLVKAKEVQVGEHIQLKPGEKLALDAQLISESGSFNTAALTGESKPDTIAKGEPVYAGMINLKTVVEVEVTTVYQDSKLSKILEMVQHASSQKAPTELFISKFAKIYTPIVVFLAIGIAFLPALWVSDYQFNDWLYRALIFLVVSCPCALVISIPLGYFGGIGAASRNGILVKGGNYLDSLAEIKEVVMDKTGTMTEGVFEVQEANIEPGINQTELLAAVNLIESKSTHPTATAIHQFVGEPDHQLGQVHVEEIPGRGLKGTLAGKTYLIGNMKLLDQFQVSYPGHLKDLVYTTIIMAVDGQYAGYLSIADRIKEDAAKTVQQLHKMQVRVTMLSGDKDAVVQYVAKDLKIDQAYGDLLPEDKVTKLKAIKSDGKMVAFVGDGVNDAPVVALSDVGMAMGGLGSDATVETADVVIQDDKPIKIPMAIAIGKKTKTIVWQNILLAFGVKAIVLILGAGGLATMWEAVFADVGVALLAILNAVRIQRANYNY